MQECFLYASVFNDFLFLNLVLFTEMSVQIPQMICMHIQYFHFTSLLIDAHVGILIDAHVGILIEAYYWYIPWMISFGTLHDIDVLRCCVWWAHIFTGCTWLIFCSWFLNSLLTYLLLHYAWYRMSLMHEQVCWSL